MKRLLISNSLAIYSCSVFFYTLSPYERASDAKHSLIFSGFVTAPEIEVTCRQKDASANMNDVDILFLCDALREMRGKNFAILICLCNLHPDGVRLIQ